MKKILVITPHPDDEVLGCGGTIAKHSKQGDEVHICFITKAYLPQWSPDYINNRQEEIKKSVQILGVKNIHELNFLTAKVDQASSKDLNDKILQVVNEVEPNIMYIPHGGDVHKDHRLIFDACLVVNKLSSKAIKKILSYEVLSETEGGSALKPFIPNVYEDVSSFFQQKLEALKAYQSELKEPPHPRSVEIVEALAKKRGSEAGVRMAEAFMLIREVI